MGYHVRKTEVKNQKIGDKLEGDFLKTSRALFVKTLKCELLIEEIFYTKKEVFYIDPNFSKTFFLKK